MNNRNNWINLWGADNPLLLLLGTLALTVMLAASVKAHGPEPDDNPPTVAALESEQSHSGGDSHGHDEAETDTTSGHALGDARGDRMTEDDHAHGADESHSDAAADSAHDHSTHGPSNALLETGFGRFLVWLGKLHPAAVHFPIALLMGAALAELLSTRFKPEFFGNAARFCLWLGAFGALGAASLGWLYGGFRLVDEETVLALHRWNGTAIALLALLALWLNETRVRAQPSRKGMYRSTLFLTALLVGLNGYLGGFMVYGPEQHQWPTMSIAHTD